MVESSEHHSAVVVGLIDPWRFRITIGEQAEANDALGYNLLTITIIVLIPRKGYSEYAQLTRSVRQHLAGQNLRVSFNRLNDSLIH